MSLELKISFKIMLLLLLRVLEMQEFKFGCSLETRLKLPLVSQFLLDLKKDLNKFS